MDVIGKILGNKLKKDKHSKNRQESCSMCGGSFYGLRLKSKKHTGVEFCSKQCLKDFEQEEELQKQAYNKK